MDSINGQWNGSNMGWSIVMGVPNSWMVSKGRSDIKMDDAWEYPHDELETSKHDVTFWANRLVRYELVPDFYYCYQC